MNDYLDYNNVEVSNYPKEIDPRELNVVQRIKEVANVKPPIIEDDKVSIFQMKITNHLLEEKSDDNDEYHQEEIDEIKERLDIDEDNIIIV